MKIVLGSDGSVELLRGEKITRGQDKSRYIFIEWLNAQSPIETNQILTDNLAVDICITRPDGEQSGWYQTLKADGEIKYYYNLQAWDTCVSGIASVQVRYYDSSQEEREIFVSSVAEFVVDIFSYFFKIFY